MVIKDKKHTKVQLFDKIKMVSDLAMTGFYMNTSSSKQTGVL